VAAEEKDATVKVTVNGKEQKELKKVKLVEGDNTIVIEVTSPDKKEKKTYTFELEGVLSIFLIWSIRIIRQMVGAINHLEWIRLMKEIQLDW
jgi:hypothetical protein